MGEINKNFEKCKYIQANIHKLCQIEIDEIFKILYKNNSTYTQNNNGVFVNLNWTKEDVLLQIYNYINFCLTSQTEINKYEIMKNMITDTMNNKEKIDDKNLILSANTSNAQTGNNVMKHNKISSSMKFYLLKKKFLKKNNLYVNNVNNTLTYDEYVIAE
jgi:hypothetical protein